MTNSITVPRPDYFQSFGLGFYEYFQLAEDIGAVPLPILNCGMACQFNSGELAQFNDTKEYIQDALDLIEFANGPVNFTLGEAARVDGPSVAISPDDDRSRQRAMGKALCRTLQAVRGGSESKIS